jgi:hypothetical protein
MKTLKNILKGMAQVFDLSGSLYHLRTRQILNTSDADKIASDWQRVGDDLRNATNQYKKDFYYPNNI